MLKKHFDMFNYITSIASGLYFCVLGFSCIFARLAPWNWLYLTFVIGISVVGCVRILNFLFNFRNVHQRLSKFLDMIIWLILIIISLSNESLFHFILPRMIGAWILLHALVKGITIYIKISDHLPGWVHSLIFLIGDLIMAIILLFIPDDLPFVVNLVMGGYFILYGGNMILEIVREIIPANSGEKLDNKIRLALPPFLAAIIPPTLMRTILDKDAEDQARDEFEAIKKDIPYDLEVYVHIAPSGPAMLGHVDIVYRDILMSYGCYDPHNRRLVGTLGDGVVIVAPKNAYLYNCLANENKVLVGFGIALNQAQKQSLNQRILEAFEGFQDFDCDEQLKQKGLPYQGICDDYLSRVTRVVKDAHFYKYKEGKFKTFFVLSSNCVSFITNLLGSIGLNLIEMSGVISPGSYFDFLNNEFKSDKSFVISRHIYTKKSASQFKDDSVS